TRNKSKIWTASSVASCSRCLLGCCWRQPVQPAHGRATMTPRDLSATVLDRRALVYVRQSTSTQVQENRESQRRQYALAELARSYGFRDVSVIDADLGCSASGTVDRPGFRTLVGQVCQGVVGAVFCLEASRLARNGRDWHHLIELCGLVGALVVDADGIYNPAKPNDRLLLGLKGTMSEFELTRCAHDCSRPRWPRPAVVSCVFRYPLDTSGRVTPDSHWTRIVGSRMPSGRCSSSSSVWAARGRSSGTCARKASCFRAQPMASS